VFLFAQATGIETASVWSPAMVTALFTGIAILIAAVSTAVLQQRMARKEAAERGVKTDAKLTGIHESQNGANTALLERVERLTAQVAALTNAKRDLQEAAVAEGVADAKRALTVDIATKKEAAAFKAEEK
jgi:hypothetical protein